MITERDREIVGLLDRSGGLEVVSLRVMLRLGHAVAYRRPARLSEYGMVRPEAPFRGSAALFVPTRLGLREVLGLADAKSPAVSAWSYNHQRQVGRVLAQLHAHGVAWESSRVTRRRRVAAEQAGDLMKSKRLALGLPRTRSTHLPDALIWSSDQSRERDRPIAIEVELAQKSRARLDEILGEYGVSIGFRGVVYVCDPKCHRAVLTAARNRSNVSVTTLDEFGGGIALPKRPGRKPFDVAGHDTTWMKRWLTRGTVSALEEAFDRTLIAGSSPRTFSRSQLSMDV